MASITRTVASSGADHTTIAAAISYIDTNWTGYAGSDVATVQIIGAEEFLITSTITCALPTAGGTPSATSYLKIEATDAVKHDGTYNTSKARIRTATNGVHCFTVTDNFVHLKNLAIKNDSTGDSDECIRIGTDTSATYEGILIEKCVLYGNNAANGDCIHAGQCNLTSVYVFDTILHTGGTTARANINASIWTGTSRTQNWYIEHCTSDANETTDGGSGNDEAGISAFVNDISSTVNYNIYNTISVDTNHVDLDDFNVLTASNGTVNWSGAGNIASDTSAEGNFTSSFDSVTMRTSDASGEQFLVTSLTADSEDYRPVAGSTGTDVALGAAASGATQDSRVDLTLDCGGNARPGTYTDRDIGALQSAGGTNETVYPFTGPWR
jgi:hypothetical protein